MFKFDFAIDDIDEEFSSLSVEPEPSKSPQEAHPTVPSREHPIEEFLDALPTLISYSPLSIPVPSKDLTVHLVRRDLFDARFQLIAEGTVDPEDADGHLTQIKEEDEDEEEKERKPMDPSILEYLDAPSDLLPGVYEGGLKTWECSLDLVEYLESSDSFKSYSGNRVIELGCGTAIPSLYVLLKALSEPPSPTETHIHLQDYNASVLELVTFPNALLTWYLSPASLSFRTSTTPTDPSNPTESAPTIDPTEAGELPITPALKSAFLASLKDHNIVLRFFSGAWESFSLSSSGGAYNLLLTSETIYRQEALPSLMRLLDEGSGLGLGLDEMVEAKLSLDDGERERERVGGMCLVAAKVLYFGVGGGISDFVDMVKRREEGRRGEVSTVLERTAGIGRKVLRVDWE
ncbi:hypothetical protein DFP72DRAFT_1000579 [Ephemerocybe angulata]|uniref:protein-histidine N-methyltransferase n=1 Tax=Ephemerocybe angulata TaxID=980116 RepID=A0A8H6IG27_9AGAR|nr:hypothetical protein DFP72DRAFT_1000579 [Tulosesus angulatus]